jgi:hypothetical protein
MTVCLIPRRRSHGTGRLGWERVWWVETSGELANLNPERRPCNLAIQLSSALDSQPDVLPADFLEPVQAA